MTPSLVSISPANVTTHQHPPPTKALGSSGLAIPLSDLPLRPSTLQVFSKHGFVTVQEVLREQQQGGGGLSTLAAELDLSLTDTDDLVQEVTQCCLAQQLTPWKKEDANGVNSSMSLSAYDVFMAEQEQLAGTGQIRHIVTFSRSLDQLLGGGIALGEVTEVVGMPGTGKTQLAMQLCVNARIPTFCGGVAGRAIYIDSEGSFSPERSASLASALVKHVQSSHARKIQQQHLAIPPLPSDFSVEGILSGISVYRVHDETTQSATLYSLRSLLEEEQGQNAVVPVRLIVIDSLAFHYRCESYQNASSYLQRTQQLTALAGYLSDLASCFQVAVVVVNHMTTKFSSSNASTSRHTPALGESWAHATTTRLLLAEPSLLGEGVASSSQRVGTLLKSPTQPAGSAPFAIWNDGIRDDKSVTRKRKHLGESEA